MAPLSISVHDVWGREPIVLVVDDDEAVAKTVAALLRSADCSVFIALDVQTALDTLDAIAPDVVLTDIYMPGMDGFELMRALRARRSALPVVVMSGGQPGMDALGMAEKLGAAGVIDKPFRLAQITEVIDRCLGRWPKP
jgi:two-component system response regulator FixJ